MAPILVHFDEQFEEDFLAEEGLEVTSCVASDSLERGSGSSDEDAFLRVAFDVDYGADTNDGGLLF